ncbi:HGxxPAAW family protein [Actinoallomurus sp. NPDC052308]|uniref:HGxxPAAW family protein n=1 Tax=Actinoallomurus sp. NPDC052308 TaxID=3155530 RepID=UPI00342E7A35
MAGSSHGGRLSSWVAVVVMWIGFGVGGVAMVSGPSWWLFWTGVGIVAVGGVIGLIVRIFDDVIIDAPRIIPEEAHPAVLHARAAGIEGPAIATDPQTTHPHG